MNAIIIAVRVAVTITILGFVAVLIATGIYALAGGTVGDDVALSALTIGAFFGVPSGVIAFLADADLL